jgi:hypothetical protein
MLPASRPPNKRLRRRDEAYPLHLLDEDTQRRIAVAVAQPTPPEPEFLVGAPDSPRPLAVMESRAWWEWHWQRGLDPDATRPKLAPSLRAAVIQRDGYVCQLCWGDVAPGDVHLDHIKPWSQGGRDVLSNLQVTHSACKLRKGATWTG